MPIKFKNNVVGFLATPISASDTGIVLQAGNGSNFPTLGLNDYFYATLVSAAGTLEIVRVTARVGDTMTVARGADGTTPTGFAAGSRVEMRITAASIAETSGSGVGSTVFDIRAYGAVGDGVTDNALAIQAALDAANAAGGGVVYIPTGRFRKLDTPGRQWRIYSNTTLRGEGDTSVIFFDDRSSIARSGNDMLRFDNVVNIEFKDFRIEGTALTYLSETNQKQCLTGSICDGFRMENVTIVGTRYMATAFSYIKNAIVTGCRLDYIIRDGLRFTNSENVIITNNTLRRVADDCVALHSLDAATTPSSGFVVSNNTFEGCQGIKILGAKTVTISNNVFRRTLRNPIEIRAPGSGTEGNTPQFAINITNNVLMDSFGNRGTNFVIAVRMAIARAKGALSLMPGVSADPRPYNYLNDIDAGTINPGQYGINVSNNIIGNSLPTGAAYSTYGYGQLFDRTIVGLLDDPVMASNSYSCHSLFITGPSIAMAVTNNIFSGGNVGFSAILTTVIGSANLIDYGTMLVANNIVYDFPSLVINPSSTGSGAGAQQYVLLNNLFDLDPYFRSSEHNPDNTWTSGTNCTAIRATTNVNAIYCGGNVVKNAGGTGFSDSGAATLYPNIIYSDFVGSSDNAGNKGVRRLPEAANNIIIPIDGDPTSATYGQVLSKPLTVSSSMPTSGRYVVGAFVRKFSPTLEGTPGAQYVVFGWARVTTGSNHVLNTDWYEMRCLTGT